MLGGKFVKLAPGHAADTIPPDGAIGNTKTYKALEEMVGEIIFLATDSGPKASSPAVGESKGK